MARSRSLASLKRMWLLAEYAARRGMSVSSVMEQAEEARFRREQFESTRRNFLRYSVGAAALAVGALSLPGPVFAGGKKPRIAIIGAGLAGLVCADTLRQHGYAATLYEARDRLGGRVHSSNAFAGRAVEYGAEWIDSGHTTVLAYAKEFGLKLEDRQDYPGETHFYFQGQRYGEADLIEQFRQFVPRIKNDYDNLGEPVYTEFTDFDKSLDRTDMASYLDRHANDLPLLRAILDTAYTIEYGLNIDQQSAINLLSMLDIENLDRFSPFGESDERYHVAQGNDRIVHGLADRLKGPIVKGAALSRLARNKLGQYELYFQDKSKPEVADAVVIAVPFSVLRHVELDKSLGLSALKRKAIAELRYGTNAKTMIAFKGRPWATEHKSNGEIYGDLANLQNVWESGQSGASDVFVLTDFAGGARGAALQLGAATAPLACSSCHGEGSGFLHINDNTIHAQADLFLNDLEKVWPKIKSHLHLRDGKPQLLRGHWLAQPTSRGSYVCNHPGYFTEFAGVEAEAAGLLKFAGEHTDSYYSAQGYMEGACLSGIRAANELLEDLRQGSV